MPSEKNPSDATSRPGPDLNAAPQEPLARLLWVMAWLRTPEHGCAWDLQQDFHTIAPYTVEEAYEVVDAIEQQDMSGLKEELGDLLLQVVFHARMAEEAELFAFADVAASIADKMVQRHPHVFAETPERDLSALHRNWEARKKDERQQKAHSGAVGTLDGVAKALPALLRAHKLQKRAASVGFDWQEWQPVFAKVEEELVELRSALLQGLPDTEIEAEIGDVLFSVTNLSRHLGIGAEQALKTANAKFEKRFRYIENKLRQEGLSPDSVDTSRLEREWVLAKQAES